MDNLISLYNVYVLYANEGNQSGFLKFLKQECPLNMEVGRTFILDNSVGYPQDEITIQSFKDDRVVIVHKGRTLGNYIYKIDEAHEGLCREIFDYYDAIYKAELKKIQKEEAQRQKESYQDLKGFGNDLPPIQKGKLQKTLNKEVYVLNPEDNTPTWMKRKEFIEAAVKAGGWEVTLWEGSRILRNSTDKSFYPPHVIPQTCLDYFLYLNSKQE
jgi:hypothetical protein